MVLNILNIWSPLFAQLGIDPLYHMSLAVVSTFLVMYIVGFVVTHPRVNRILKNIPLIKNAWNIIKNITDRLLFISRGGYKRVVYELYGYETKRYRPALVIGRTVFMNPDGTKQNMLVIAQPPPNIFDPLWVPMEETKIITNPIGDLGLYIASGGFVSPPQLDLMDWTEEEYHAIPKIKNSTKNGGSPSNI